MRSPSPPPVSVIIPVYNRPAMVREALASVLAQTFRNFEILAVDDGSTDDTPERLEEAAEGAPLRVIRIEHCGKPGAVRNRGVEAARGELLAFLDSDDLWAPEKLESQLALHGVASAAPRISHTRERWLRNGREVSQGSQRHRRAGDLFVDSLKKCIIGPSTVMMERSLFEELGGFREDVEIAEDYELWLRVTHREPVAYLDEALTVKRAGPWDQLSERHGGIELFRIQALRELVEQGGFGDNPEHAAEARRELGRKCRIYASGCRKRGREAEAQEYELLARSL